MEPKMSERNEQNRNRATVGVITLAVVSLLAGASVAATLEDYAAPRYAEEDPFEGAVDDATGEDTWEEKESDERPMGKHIRKAMKNRMNDRMEDRTEHLEKRIDIDSNLIIAFQFCLDSPECAADDESLTQMVDKLTFAVSGMQAKIDGTETTVDSDESESRTEEKNQEICKQEGSEPDERGYCYVADYKDWDERKDWDETKRMEFAEEKAAQLRAAQEAISFCIESEFCSADSQTIETTLEHMNSRANHHAECADDRRCTRDHDTRKGFRGRMGGVLCKMLDRCEDRERGAPPSIEVTQEMCESRMGVWTEAADRGEGVFYCEWSQPDEEPDREDGPEADEREDEEESPDNQEECEANGGTWYEDRQHCHTE